MNSHRHIAMMEAHPTRAYNQDDATGFIRLNALRLKVQQRCRGRNCEKDQKQDGRMRAIAIMILSSWLVLDVPAQESKGTYYSDKEDEKLVQGGYLERSNFYPSGNSGQLQLLVMCIDRGDTSVLERLLDAVPDFANCNERASRCSPVHWAAFKGDTNVLGVLVKKQADVKRKGTNWDISALHIARDAKTANFLIQHGADIEAKAANGQTPLMWAAKRGNVELAHVLIEKGASLEAKDENESTALYLAETYGRTNAARLLISKGAIPLGPGRHELRPELVAGNFSGAGSEHPFAERTLIHGTPVEWSSRVKIK